MRPARRVRRGYTTKHSDCRENRPIGKKSQSTAGASTKGSTADGEQDDEQQRAAAYAASTAWVRLAHGYKSPTPTDLAAISPALTQEMARMETALYAARGAAPCNGRLLLKAVAAARRPARSAEVRAGVLPSLYPDALGT